MSRGGRSRGGRGGGLSLGGRLALFAGAAALVGCLLLTVLAGQGTDPKVLFLLALGCAGGVAGLTWREGNMVGHRLVRLALSVGKLARGDFNARFGGAGFQEAGRLSRQLEELAANLREGVVEEQLSAIREKEAKLLGRMREKMVPDRIDPPAGWEVEGVFVPGKRGGGDFFDVIEGDRKTWLVIGSAEGAGTAAGMVMVMGRTLLREWLAREDDLEPVLHRLNATLRAQTVAGACLSLSLLVIDPAVPGRVQAWGAGLRAPLYYYGQGRINGIALEGISFGLDDGPVFSRSLVARDVELARGQRLVLVTPGLCANLSPQGEEYGEERLEEAIVRHGPKNTTVFVDLVAGDVEEWLEDEEPDEDLVLLSAKYTG